jgi:hypothetical protein
VEVMQDTIAGDTHHVSSWYEFHCCEGRKVSFVQYRVAETKASRCRVVGMNGEGTKDVVWTLDIDDMVGVMISRGKQYVLNRRNQILTVDDGDEE